MTNPIAAALGARPGESLLDAARRVQAEREQARKDKHFFIERNNRLTQQYARARNWARVWKRQARYNWRDARLAHDALGEANDLRAAAVLAKEAWQRGEATRRAQGSHIEQLRGVLTDVSAFLGDPVDAEDAYTRNLIERVRRFL